jgi:hypothetical protein
MPQYSAEGVREAFEGLDFSGDKMSRLFQEAVAELGEDQTLEIIFESCNFRLARDEIAAFFELAEKDAKLEGHDVFYPTEFVQGWQAFSANPNADTVRAWLHVAPAAREVLHTYLIQCCPGGSLSLTAALDLPHNRPGRH